MGVTREQRFSEFLRRLSAAGAANSPAEALSLIAATLAAVEDSMTDIPHEPARWQTDGRMYPPQEDCARHVADRPDLVRYRSRGHNTLIRDNGAIEIRNLQGEVLLSKLGKNGRGVEL